LAAAGVGMVCTFLSLHVYIDASVLAGKGWHERLTK